VQIRTLEEVHSGTNSLLHHGARDVEPDLSAFIYSILRLPACINQVKTLVLGQSTGIFSREGVGDIETWQPVAARARRRRCYFDGEETLACIIASRSDIDDVVPIITAYQVEWRKLHNLLRMLPEKISLEDITRDPAGRAELAQVLRISADDLERLRVVWGKAFEPNLKRMTAHAPQFQIRLLDGTLTEYRRATNAWWENIEQTISTVRDRPVYFVSSNTHSLVNLLSGYALQKRKVIVEYLENNADNELLQEWKDIQDQMVPSSQENFLYYVMKKFLSSPQGQHLQPERLEYERKFGIRRIDSKHFFDVDAQVIELSKMPVDRMDPRICDLENDALVDSDALILNIDYPLGLAGYNILTELATHVGDVLGVYIMGKSATLNGVIGDVLIPNIVHDEHSRNTFIFSNAFMAADVAPYLVYGTVLDNQKAVTVQGTFLQNASYMDVFYREGYTDIEMEAGPYLSAVYEMYRPKRHPVDEIVYLQHLPFDFGLLHYASDTPLSKGKNLGASSLSYFGMDPTYATSLAILRRILRLEQERLSN